MAYTAGVTSLQESALPVTLMGQLTYESDISIIHKFMEQTNGI